MLLYEDILKITILYTRYNKNSYENIQNLYYLKINVFFLLK